jgi:hypothetical protein
MQYTSSSFGDALVRLFAFVLRPAPHDVRIEGAFPGRSRHATHVGDVMLSRILLPLVYWVADRFTALRQQQSGRIQIYILYVALATIAILLTVVPAFNLLRNLVTR